MIVSKPKARSWWDRRCTSRLNLILNLCDAAGIEDILYTHHSTAHTYVRSSTFLPCRMRAAFPFSHVWMFLYEFDFSNHLIEYCGTDGTAPQKLLKFRDFGFTRKTFWFPKCYWKWPIFCTHSKYMLNAHVTCSFITANSTRLWWNLMRLQGKIGVFELPTFFFFIENREQKMPPLNQYARKFMENIVLPFAPSYTTEQPVVSHFSATLQCYRSMK